jgi:hypothetical protein
VRCSRSSNTANVTTTIGKTLPLTAAAEARHLRQSREVSGKIVLVPGRQLTEDVRDAASAAGIVRRRL